MKKVTLNEGVTAMSMSYRALLLFVIACVFAGCSSNSGSGSNSSSLSSTTGQFIDDAVQGLSYSCSSGMEGVTNEEGEYTCAVGDDVTFNIGVVTIGTIAAQTGYITPYSFFPNNIAAALNLARLLQTVDADPNDSIIILDEALVALLPDDTDFTSPTFEAGVESALNMTLVSATDAQNQLNESILAVGGEVPNGGHIPVADAGSDQNVLTSETVTLDGTNSTDADGDTLSYLWTILSAPAGSTASLSDPALVNPTFTADTDGSYVVQLVVGDGTVTSAADTVTITATSANAAPVADAGDDQNVLTSATVTLDGSASSDANQGDTLTYLWSMTSVPKFSKATLSDVTLVKPTFRADLEGTYIVQLIVDDGTVISTADTVTIVATTENAAPVADAGDDQNVVTFSTVTLDGSASFDANTEDTLTYLWSMTSIPAASKARLSDPTLVNPTFTTDMEGSYIAQLIVHDGTVSSEADTVTIVATTANAAPVADAGPDQEVTTTDTVTLDGSLSSDAESGGMLTYQWSITSAPAGSMAMLSGATLVNPTFDADKAGSYVVRLIVNDGADDSVPDTVTVTAVTEEVITHNSLTYGTVISPYTGRKWLDRNLGATQVCTARDDGQCYGEYYQWGRSFNGHQLIGSPTDSILVSSLSDDATASVPLNFIATTVQPIDWVVAAEDSDGSRRAAQWRDSSNSDYICPDGYRVPTISELNAETIVANDRINTIKAFESFLKIPAAGWRHPVTGNYESAGEFGSIFMWSSSIAAPSNAFNLSIQITGYRTDSSSQRAFGGSVRCIQGL